MKRLKIGVVEDDTDIRETLAYVIEQTPSMELLFAARGAKELFDMLENSILPDIITMDLWLAEWTGNLTGADCAKRIYFDYPSIKTLFISAISNSPLIFRTVGRGHLKKPFELEEFLNALRIVGNGNTYFVRDSDVTDYLPVDPKFL